VTKRDALAKKMRKAYALFIQAMVDGRMSEEEIGNLEDAIGEVRILLSEVIADKEETGDVSRTQDASQASETSPTRPVGSGSQRRMRIGGRDH